MWDENYERIFKPCFCANVNRIERNKRISEPIFQVFRSMISIRLLQLRNYSKFPIETSWSEYEVATNRFLFVTLQGSQLKALGWEVSVGFRGISRLCSAFIFLRWFILAHICIYLNVLSTMGLSKESMANF